MLNVSNEKCAFQTEVSALDQVSVYLVRVLVHQRGVVLVHEATLGQEAVGRVHQLSLHHDNPVARQHHPAVMGNAQRRQYVVT